MSDVVSKELKDLVLSFPKQFKLRLLKNSQSEGENLVVMTLITIYTEAPISEGGISSNEIQNILK